MFVGFQRRTVRTHPRACGRGLIYQQRTNSGERDRTVLRCFDRGYTGDADIHRIYADARHIRDTVGTREEDARQ